jgi:hypothetical protein
MEISMKTILLTGMAAALLITAQTALAQPGRAPICLPTRNIAQTSPSPDGRAITFRMTDGSVWRNDLRGRCPDLRWSGFSWTTSDPMERVCENEQTISVIRSAEVCALGNFTQLEPAGHHNFASGER